LNKIFYIEINLKMSEYWKSNAKKYCDYCKVWISDNKASINIHESGKNHKDSVKAKLEDVNIFYNLFLKII
jgi:hypothetical protein